MKWLLGILLLIGLIQSLLDLKNNSDKDDKNNIRNKILPILFISAFIIGLTVMIFQENESNKLNNLTEDISEKVKKIDSISDEQIEILNINIDRSKLIIDRIDSIQKSTNELLQSEKALISQYQSVNERLRKQIEIDLSKIKEKKAAIELSERNMNWEFKTDSSFSLKLCISNVGGRNAEILSGDGFVLFFDKESKPYADLKIPGNHLKQYLAPTNLKGDLFCFYSFGITNSMESLKSKISFAIIKLNITYRDVVLDTIETKEIYKVWIPKDDEFGGPRDWQIKLFNDWFNKK